MSILDCVAYTELSPSCLVWTKRVAYRVTVGDRAGSMRSDKYWAVEFENNSYFVHRLVWELHNGPIPDGLQVDHLDRDKSNNRIDNLRLASVSQNNQHKPKQKNNTSGYKGVHWHKRHNCWVATIQMHRKVYHLGNYKSPVDAHKAYCAKAEELHKEFKCTV